MESKPAIQKLLHRVPNASELLDQSRAQTYKLIADGEIEVIRVGKSIRVPHDALVAFVERKKAEAQRAA